MIASVYGHSAVLSATPEKGEELAKMLSSILLQDDDYLVLDNVRGGIGDAQFERFHHQRLKEGSYLRQVADVQR